MIYSFLLHKPKIEKKGVFLQINVLQSMFRTTEGFKLQMNFTVKYSHSNFYFCSGKSCNYLWLKIGTEPIQILSALSFCKYREYIFPVKIILEFPPFICISFLHVSIYSSFFQIARRVQVHCKHSKHNNYLTSPTVLHLGKRLYTPFHHYT